MSPITAIGIGHSCDEPGVQVHSRETVAIDMISDPKILRELDLEILTG